MKEVWEVDLRSRETGNSVETIFSSENHDEACAVLNKWYEEHGLHMECLEDYIDESDGVFADIYLTDEPHGVGKWD